MSVELRNYQDDMITKARISLRTYRNVLLQSPTGSGKTVLAGYMMNRIIDNNKRAFFICHRRELVDQTSKTFRKFGIQHSFIAAGYQYNPHASIYICSVDTLKNRLEKVPVPHFCIWDEAHHLGAAGWARVHAYYQHSYHVGLSATPQRLDGKGLDDRFDHLIPGPSVSWLIDQGYLAQYKLYSVPGVDLTGVHTRMGDYVKAESEHAMDKPAITGNIISHWSKYASEKRTIGFAVSIKHSEHIVEQFNARGIPAVHLDGNTPRDIRRRLLNEFARGTIRVIFNVGLFGEGFDVAANSGLDVTVGCVIDAAPTQSLGAWLQRCGRALRPQDQAIILDHAGNALRHGLPCEEREWDLKGRDKKKSTKGQTETVRQCKKCFAVHKPAPACPECGYEYPIQSRVIEEREGELQELDPAVLRRKARREQGSHRSYDDLVRLGQQRGYKNPAAWARHVYNARVAKQMMGGR